MYIFLSVGPFARIDVCTYVWVRVSVEDPMMMCMCLQCVLRCTYVCSLVYMCMSVPPDFMPLGACVYMSVHMYICVYIHDCVVVHVCACGMSHLQIIQIYPTRRNATDNILPYVPTPVQTIILSQYAFIVQYMCACVYIYIYT
jgi:hypothetical protein